VSATATDAVGNASPTSAGFALVVDTVAPAVPPTPDLTAASDTGASSNDDITGDTTPDFSGSADAGSTVELFANGASIGTTTTNGSGNWTFVWTTDSTSAALADGNYDITATATDAAGNASPASTVLSIIIVSGSTITGTPGDDTLNGTGANDLIEGLAGNDTLDGNAGDDVLVGGSGADILFGDSGADILFGGDGIDILIGSDGDDILDGGPGGDHLFGGAGADTFVFTDGDGNDIIMDWEDGPDRLDFSNHSAVSDIGDLVIEQAENEVDTRISFGSDSVLLTNVMATDIDASDLIF